MTRLSGMPASDKAETKGWKTSAPVIYSQGCYNAYMADVMIVAERFRAKRHPWTPKYPAKVPVASSQALKQAMMLEGLSQRDFDDLLWIMAQESMGQVGVKNQSGSSAQGLFQLLYKRWDSYYPNGARSIGNAVEECQGGIRYH